MTCVLPPDIEQQLSARAAARSTTVDKIVLEAVAWYLNVSDETLDELTAWQEIRDEADELIELQRL